MQSTESGCLKSPVWHHYIFRQSHSSDFAQEIGNRDFLGPQDPEGSTSLILIKPGTMNWGPGRIKMYSVSCVTRKSLTC